jgi:hypothetical protein
MAAAVRVFRPVRAVLALDARKGSGMTRFIIAHTARAAPEAAYQTCEVLAAQADSVPVTA